MRPRQFGKVDASTAWDCRACGYKHHPDAVCVTPGEWLVLTLCPLCNPARLLYCHTHRDRHMPQPGAFPPPPDGADHGQRAAGEGDER